MAQELTPIDATNVPEMSALVREVVRTGQPRVIQADGAAAVLSPAGRRRKRTATQPTQADFEAAMNATFGSLNGLIDPEEFKRQRRELQVDDREPRTL